MSLETVKVAYRRSVYQKHMTREIDDNTRKFVISVVRTWVEESSKAAVAERLGVTKPTIKAVLDGEAGARVARAVADEMKITVNELERLAAENAQKHADETQLAPPASGLIRHRDYPPLRARLLETFAPLVVQAVDAADQGNMPEFLTWEYVKKLALAKQTYLLEKAERETPAAELAGTGKRGK